MRVASALEFFPSDAIGAGNASDGKGRLLQLDLDGLAAPVFTDIAGDKKIFRARAPWRQFFAVHDLRAGDFVVFQKSSDRRYRVSAKPVPRSPKKARL